MLAFLLDEQISRVIMEQLRQKRPDIRIESVQLWRNADLHGKGGVIFVDRNTIAADNVGALVKALIAFHDQYHSLPWPDLVMFLAPTAR